MKGVTSREFLDEYARFKRGIERFDKFVEAGFTKDIALRELLWLVHQSIRLYWLTIPEHAESLEPKE